MSAMKELHLRRLDLQELQAEVDGSMLELMSETDPEDWLGVEPTRHSSCTIPSPGATVFTD